MTELLTHRWTLFALRIALGAIFVYAGITKVLDPLAFADSIASFQLVPDQLINFVALGLPVFEVIVGLFLVIGFRKRAAAFSLTYFCHCYNAGYRPGNRSGLRLFWIERAIGRRRMVVARARSCAYSRRQLALPGVLLKTQAKSSRFRTIAGIGCLIKRQRRRMGRFIIFGFFDLIPRLHEIADH